jgi:NADH:ubiquinone oxidoreductase subunit 2 (subunit N)
MTKRDVLSIAFKIMGVYFIYLAILTIPQIGMSISLFSKSTYSPGFNSPWYIIGSIVYPIWLLGFAFVFFRFSDSMTELLIPNDTELPQVDAIQNQKPIFTLALRIFGILCLTKGIPNLAAFFAKLYRVKQAVPGDIYLNSNELISIADFINLVSAIVLIGLGGYLISGGMWLVNFVYKEKTTPESLNENNL